VAIDGGEDDVEATAIASTPISGKADAQGERSKNPVLG
jgi:hypothetical protein